MDINSQSRRRWMPAPVLAALAIVLSTQAFPAIAQSSDATTGAASADARIRRLESEIRAIQRKVFPGTDGRSFTADMPQPTITPPLTGQPATTPVTDLLTRMDAIEAQMARLTAQVEQNGNRVSVLEARIAAAAPIAPDAATPPAASTTGSTPTPAPNANLSAMSGGASAPRPTSRPATTPAPAAPTAPTAQRLAAVRAIEKPATADPGDDEYSYGFRLWEAKFYPEAQQQLKLMIDRYPRHAKLSYARNLLGRAYLDDKKPRDAASWFLQNFQAAKTGERAPDSLLFLGESMRQLGDTNRACIALAEFSETYPGEALSRLKTQYDGLRSGVKCN